MSLAALLLLGITGAAPAQSAGGSAAPQDERRARWEAMPEEKREEMRRRFEELHRLPPEEQRRIRARAERLRDLQESVRESLPPEVRERWRELPPPERAQIHRRVLEGHLGEMSRFLHEHLPPEARERLEKMSPQERERALRHQIERLVIQRMERFLEEPPPWLSPEEAARLRELPPMEGRQEMARLFKEHLVREVEGNPPLFSKIRPEAWERMKGLPPPRFLPRFFFWRRGVDRGFEPWGKDRGFDRPPTPPVRRGPGPRR
jgi:hypothetical protein